MQRYTINLADRVVDDLDKFAKRQHISRAEAFKRALALLSIANSERKSGNELGIINCDDKKKMRVVGRIIGA